jgi:superfamily II DNA or RNA helicase
MVDVGQLEAAIWSIADGRAATDAFGLLRTDERTSLALLDRLIRTATEDLDAVRNLPGDEREQVVTDFTTTLDGLRGIVEELRPSKPARAPSSARSSSPAIEPEPIRLQGSWSAGHIVVWAGGRGSPPESNEALANRLESIGAPPLGWQLHTGVPLPGRVRAEALTIPVEDALGWLIAIGSGHADVGPSLVWLGRVALEGVRLAARGALVPSVCVPDDRHGSPGDAIVRWVPAYRGATNIDAFAAAMPGTVVAVAAGSSRATTIAVISAVVEAITAKGLERVPLPDAPARLSSPIDMADMVIAHLDGAPFPADRELTRDVSKRLAQWTRSVTDPTAPSLVVRLDEPADQGVWLLTVLAKAAKGKLVPIDAALRADGRTRPTAAEWARLGRIIPALDRGTAQRRGQVALSQDEAWRFMTTVGPTLASIGFDVQAPELSRRKARPALRLFAESPPGSIVGAHQLSTVAWSALFDDVELSAADVARLARQARPLVRSRGRWVEIGRLDLEKAAAALAERAAMTEMTGAEILRQTMGLDGSGLAGGVVVHGNNWANDILKRADEARATPAVAPENFHGELRSYQAEALAWIGFLDAAELGGCLALDMGLGKTPTVLAHLARYQGDGTTLVIAPAAVVGNWAAEAARFTPGLRVVVHHGTSRSTADDFESEIADADMVITTYATAVRDVDVLSARTWRRMVLDEAQAIKNAVSETAQRLRNIPARLKLALTGTPIENGAGDLWAILDHTNPGIVGARATFVAQISDDRETALRALNGILLFRRTKLEPEVAAELPDKIDELDHCTMTPEQIGMYQAVLDNLVSTLANDDREKKQGAILAAITALKQICNHPAAYRDDGRALAGRSGKLARLEELVEAVFAADERVLVFTHFATWGRRLADHLTEITGTPIACYDGSLSRGVRDRLVAEFQDGKGPGAMVLSLKAGGTGLNLTGANHVVLYDRWWNPAVEDQARDRAWRIGQSRTVISHRLVCPGTVDERVEEIVEGKRHIAQLVLPRASSIADLDGDQLRIALGLRPDELLTGDEE